MQILIIQSRDVDTQAYRLDQEKYCNVLDQCRINFMRQFLRRLDIISLLFDEYLAWCRMDAFRLKKPLFNGRLSVSRSRFPLIFSVSLLFSCFWIGWYKFMSVLLCHPAGSYTENNFSNSQLCQEFHKLLLLLRS